MERMDAIREDLSSKKYADNPKRAISFLKSVIVREQKAISKLSGDGKAPTVSFGDDGPQPSTKRDDIKEKKSVIRQVKTLLRNYRQSINSDKNSNRGGTTNKVTGESGQNRNASTGRSRGGGAGAPLDLSQGQMRRITGKEMKRKKIF
tara:strand:+ start:46 stop:489 length:444 start_codon:yes stop_codon:yes gene_type:complete